MKKLLLIVSFLFPVLSYAQSKKPVPSTYDVLIGTYTNGTSKGIYVYRLYEETGKLSYLNEFTNVDDTAFTNPSYLCVSNNNKFVYAVNENTKGGVTALTFNANTGKMKFINNQPSQGADPCYVAVDKDQKNIFIANYSSGSLAVLPVNKDGSLSPASQVIQDAGTGPVKDRQEGPHVHMAALSPNEKFLLYNDLGTDKINIERYHASKPQPLSPADPAFVSVAPGNGPRHIVFSADGKHAYLIQEIGGFINAYNYDNGKLTQIQSLDMKLPAFGGNIGSAAIKISPDGRFLYASNRGNANEIVVYSINADNGQLTYVSRSSTLGKGPRDFSIDPQGKFLIVANQNSDSIYVYRLDKKTGSLTGVVSNLNIGNPVCLKIVSAE
ncbi:lactonase family protein [Mucilaginibacter sp. X5P1]|uniref:lactonase family protein n=1 Tax=Mucilaginibacter sp. X5P1 TaxID=2723088 RepID=UPI00160AE31E|nr:lactonase family protein [Mucilaginibacter sp. X5P1]MBB6139791.1 6-phosphogluconolactonase [Mucilaginibacter sp. X5P1]